MVEVERIFSTVSIERGVANQSQENPPRQLSSDKVFFVEGEVTSWDRERQTTPCLRGYLVAVPFCMVMVGLIVR